MTLHDLKLAIWTHKKIHRNPIDLQVFADRACVRLPITQIHEAEKLLKFINKRKRKAVPVTPEQFKRYRDAKYNHQCENNKAWIAGGHFIEPERPSIGSANDLQKFIKAHAEWMGCDSNRINTTGRKVDGKWITGTTKKGSADVELIIQGRAVHLEIKFGNDKPSDHQIKRQQQVRNAKGVYEFIHSVDEYFQVFDRYYSKQGVIFDTAAQ